MANVMKCLAFFRVIHGGEVANTREASDEYRGPGGKRYDDGRIPNNVHVKSGGGFKNYIISDSFAT